MIEEATAGMYDIKTAPSASGWQRPEQHHPATTKAAWPFEPASVHDSSLHDSSMDKLAADPGRASCHRNIMDHGATMPCDTSEGGPMCS